MTLDRPDGPDVRSHRCLVFLPGFMTRTVAYQALLEPVAELGVEVRTLQLYRHGFRALAGHPTPTDEARLAAGVCQPIVARGTRLWLAGHSRGGQVAWRTAELVEPEGLVLVDPVDGSGPRSGPSVTVRPPRFGVTPFIIGAGLGGRCAPPRLNHERFAAAAPGARHAVVADCGHADMLEGRERALARWLCGGGTRPDDARATIGALIAAHLRGEQGPGGPDLPLPVVWRR